MDAKAIELYFLNYLANDPNFADVDVSQQSGVHDLLIKGHIVLSNSLWDQVSYLNIGSSLANAANMSSSQLDSYGANWFTTRNTTSLVAMGIDVYLADGYFDQFEVLTTDVFTTSDGAKFSPTANIIFMPSTLPIVNILGINYRHANFNTVSQNATAIEPANSITSYTIAHAGLVNVTNNVASSAPSLPETNEAYIQRIKNSLGSNTLTNQNSVMLTLFNNFPGIVTDCFSIGFGDPEMQRDVAVFNAAWSFHSGNTVDIYVRSNTSPAAFSVNAFKLPNQNAYRFYMKRYKGYDVSGSDSSNPNPGLLSGFQQISLPDNRYMTGATTLPEMPMMFTNYNGIVITSLIDPSKTLTINDIVIDPTTEDYKVVITPLPGKENLRFSIYEQLQIDVYFTSSLEEMVNIYFPYYTVLSLEEIQNYVTSPANNVNCIDTVVKSFIPCEITNLTIFVNKNYPFTQATVAATIANFINTWNSSEPIELSTLLQNVPAPVMIAEVGRDFQNPLHIVADVSSVIPPSLLPNYAGPTFVEMQQQNIDGSIWYYYSTRRITMIENAPLSASQRTVRYFIDPSNIFFKVF